MEGVWRVSKLSRILLKKISHAISPSLFTSILSVIIANNTSNKNLLCNISSKNLLFKVKYHLVQHQSLNALKRSQKCLSAPSQKSCSHQGGVGVDTL